MLLFDNYNVNLRTYELMFFVAGERITTFGDKVMNESPDSLRFLPPNVKKGIYQVETLSDGSCIDIYFDTPDVMPSETVNLKNMSELKPLFIKMYNIWKSKKKGFYAESMSILYEIIGKIKSHNLKYTTDAQGNKILPSYNYMLENFLNKKFDYKKMCEKSGLSYDYFKDIFVKHYKLPPVKYVTYLRIEKAKELLITGHFSVSEIAELCGFDNVYYFSNVFRKQAGVSPKKYNALL